MAGFVLLLAAVFAVSLISQAPWLLGVLAACLVARVAIGRGRAGGGTRQ